jgi:uncharacterized protein YqhQ
MNTKNIDTKITDLIRQTDDIQFLGIYKEFLTFRRKHFVEFFLLKKIPFINNLMECIEEEMDSREKIEEMASQKTDEILPEKEEQEWKKEWKKQNEKEKDTGIKNDFKKVLMYVAAFHICLFTFFIAQNAFKEEDINQKRNENMQEALYPNPNKIKGPISDSLGKRK